MALAMILPAIAAPTYSLTVTTDKTSYAPGATVTISGALTADGAPAAGLYVSIIVTDSLGNNAYTMTVTTDSSGAYSTSFIDQLVTSQPAGTYTIQATAAQNGNQVATKTATYTVTTGAVTVTTKITLSPDTGIATMISGQGFTPSDTITITWAGITMVTNPMTISANSAGSFTASVVALNQTTPGAYTVKAIDQHGLNATATFTVPNLQGPAGAKGDQGATGQAGTNGSNGSNGSNGADGTQGPVGPSGAPGPSGVPGDAGISQDSNMPLTAIAIAVVALIIGLVAAFLAVTLRRKIAS
jgi:MG2 domain./Collagen triple helix repeat (20 copies).